MTINSFAAHAIAAAGPNLVFQSIRGTALLTCRQITRYTLYDGCDNLVHSGFKITAAIALAAHPFVFGLEDSIDWAMYIGFMGIAASEITGSMVPAAVSVVAAGVLGAYTQTAEHDE